MSKYITEFKKHCKGNLEKCIQFMKDNPPKNREEFYELKPIIDVWNGHIVTSEEYECNLMKCSYISNGKEKK